MAKAQALLCFNFTLFMKLSSSFFFFFVSVWGLNTEPHICYAGAIPLSYIPALSFFIWKHGSFSGYPLKLGFPQPPEELVL
jgi:hypothetical protein